MLSGISPTIARLQLRDLHSSGTIVGRLSAWATAGALTGTFGTGFVLVPLLPVSTSVLAIGIMLIVVGFALGAYTGVFHRRTGAATVSLTVALALLTLAQHSPCQAETAYNCVQVETFPQQPAVKVLLLDRGYNSDVDPSDPSYLGFSYERWLSEAIAGLGRPGTPLDGVFVGGGRLHHVALAAGHPFRLALQHAGGRRRARPIRPPAPSGCSPRPTCAPPSATLA